MKKIFFFLAIPFSLGILASAANAELLIDLLQGEPGFFAYEFTDRGADFVRRLFGTICLLVVVIVYISCVFYVLEGNRRVPDNASGKTCIRKDFGSDFFTEGQEYEYIETGDVGFDVELDAFAKKGFRAESVSKMVRDNNGDWIKYDNYLFGQMFTIKQPNQ